MELELNEQFNKAIDLLENSRINLFITGKAGTGKSTLLQYYREISKKNLVVLAPTGVAALNVEGETIHSFFNFKPGVTVGESKKIGKSFRKSFLFQELEMIVIDEISMVRADLLDCVDSFLRASRGKRTPFGGVQMVFIGDLYQLPPVVSKEEKPLFQGPYSSPYFFSAKAVRDLIEKKSKTEIEFVELEKIYRQRDLDFIQLLNGIRNRTIEPSYLQKLNHRVLEPSGEFLENTIFLTSTNEQSDQINKQNLEKLSSPVFKFAGEMEGEMDRKHLPTDSELFLKENARVMLLNNDSFGRWVNGTLGTVAKIDSDRILVNLDNGEEVEVNPFTWTLFHHYYDKDSLSIGKKETGRFTQFPLRLSWAMTIHKSQGKTFDKVVIDLGKGAFSPGQVYVALSRCRSFEGIVLKTPVKMNHLLMDYQVVRFLTRFQYRLSDKKVPLSEKITLLNKAIEEKKRLKIVYLKSQDEKSSRVIQPIKLEDMEFKGHEFIGVQAHCFLRNDTRVFNVERILEIAEAKEE
jgi:ATP-dependent exoDNAse (exonuclease V) alpha subunit